MREGGQKGGRKGGGREEKRGGDRCYIKEECVPGLGLKSIAVRSVCLRHDANADTPSRHIVNRWERTMPSFSCPPAHLAVMEQEGNDPTVSPPQTLSTLWSSSLAFPSNQGPLLCGLTRLFWSSGAAEQRKSREPI